MQEAQEVIPKPCVNCGASAEITDNDSVRHMFWMVSCSCGCLHSCWYDSEEKAIKGWNRRAKK
jgi:hypothetical protein